VDRGAVLPVVGGQSDGELAVTWHLVALSFAFDGWVACRTLAITLMCRESLWRNEVGHGVSAFGTHLGLEMLASAYAGPA